jgi:drug/metabolite transporter (DMT)-like permease
MDVQCMVDSEVPGSNAAAPPSRNVPDVSARYPALLAAVLLVSPFFLWGTSMTLMKTLAPHTTPLFVAAVRLLPSGAVLVAWAAANGRPQPSTRIAWAWIAAFAAVDGAAFQALLVRGLQETSAGLGSVIIDSQPLTVAVLAAVLFGERLAPPAIAGLALGVAGLALLEAPPETVAGLMHPGAAAAVASSSSSWAWGTGELYMLGAAQARVLRALPLCLCGACDWLIYGPLSICRQWLLAPLW